MKKVVFKLEYYDEKIKQKAMQKVSGLSGVESISIDSKDKKLTVTGDIDPITIAGKLRKLCRTDILSVGPAKEPEKKKDDAKKDDKKDDNKKDDKKDDAKKGDDKKKDPKADPAQVIKSFPHPAYLHHYPPPHLPYNHYPPQQAPAYYARSMDEDPNACVIC